MGRFDQADPWEGSYDLSDPQSFNRYSYVNNDPVNYVDPSGLQDVIVGPCPAGQCVVTVYGSVGGLFGGGGGGLGSTLHPPLIDGPELSPDGGGGAGGGVSTPAPPQNPAPQQRKSDFPCPPTAEEIINSPVFQAAISRANEIARSDQRRGFIEAGGWVLMNRRGNLRVVIKPPEARDTSTMVYGLGEPGRYIRGHGRREVVVADFHTHVNEISNPDEIPTANARRVPGIWIYPSGRAEAYGPKRGLFGRNLPRGCR